MLKKKSILQYSILGVFLVVFFGVTYYLNQPVQGEHPTAFSKIVYEKAIVKEIVFDQAAEDEWTEGLRVGSQGVRLTIDSGEYKGMDLDAINYMAAYNNVDLKEGSRVIVQLDYDTEGRLYVVDLKYHDRSFMLWGLLGLFMALMILFGGKKGLSALLGLAFTIFSIWFFLIPLIKRGFPAIPAAVILVSVTTFVSLIFLNGFSKKTMGAVIGCVGGVTIAGLIAHLAGLMSPINGFNMPEAEDLILRSAENVKISGLLVSGILISALGAVMDIALMITSAISELKDMNPQAKRVDLFKSGLNIGRDGMGTMANTLILAFAGTSLNTLILLRTYDYPFLRIINSDLMVLEIVQGLSGSIGIVLTVPLVAALGAYMFTNGKKTV